MTKRIIAHIGGFILIGLGVSLIIYSNQGAFPIDALNWFIANLIPSSIIDNGIVNYVVSILLAVLTYFIVKKPKVFISVIMVTFVSLAISVFGRILTPLIPDHLALKIILAPVGLLLIAFGSNFTIVSGLPSAPVEQLMMVLTQYTNSMKKARYFMEAVFLALAIITGLIYKDLWAQVNWFTLVAVLFIGPLMEFLIPANKKILGLKENN